MKKTIAVASLVGASLFTASVGLADEGPDRSTLDENVLFVVDKSGSMYGRLEGIKIAVTEIVSTLKPEHNAGLITFDGCGADRIQYPVPLARRTGRRIAQVVGTLNAEGSTALAVALEKVGEVMADKHVCPRVIIFTDEDDTCNGSPADIKERFNADREKFCLELDVISATSDKETLRNLESLANGLGGNLWQAETTEEITEAIRRIIARQHTGSGSTRGTNKPNEGGNGPQVEEGEEEGTPQGERSRAGANANENESENGNGGGKGGKGGK